MAEERNPFLAAALSFLIAGLGQLYLREHARALVFFSLEILTAATYFHYNTPVSALPNLAVSIYAAFDAHKTAVRINRDVTEREKQKEKEEDIPVVFIR